MLREVSGAIAYGLNDGFVDEDNVLPYLAGHLASPVVLENVAVRAHFPTKQIIARKQNLARLFVGLSLKLLEECGRNSSVYIDCGLGLAREDAHKVQ